MHFGPELTLKNVRLQFMIVGGKRQIRNAIKLCQHNLCKNPNLIGESPQMAILPIPRITQGNFEAMSLDLAGTIIVKLCWICKSHKVVKNAKKN